MFEVRPQAVIAVIQDSCGFGVPQEIRETHMGNYDFVILIETEILDAVYCNNRLGYDVACLRSDPTAVFGVQGSLVLVTR